MSERYLPRLRKKQILTAAVKLAHEKGFEGFTRDDVAAVAGCTAGLVGHYYDTMDQLRKAVMFEAITHPYLLIVAQGLSVRNKQAAQAPPNIKRQAAALLADV